MDWAGAFYINGASLVDASYNDFGTCYIANSGAIYYFANVASYKDSNSIYQQGVAKQGGAIYCDNCNMKIFNVKFVDF